MRLPLIAACCRLRDNLTCPRCVSCSYTERTQALAPRVASVTHDLDDIFAVSGTVPEAGLRRETGWTMVDVRNNWEGRSINGVFPLRRFLGSSNHSSVFLTESSVEGFLNAAVKIVPADPQYSQVQLWQWKTASTFSHPHLMRLLDFGQCELDGQPYLFVVMEYAEESLSQILPYRSLGPDEVQELLVPTLDALAFLHRENWVQGQLKPSNFLVVNDQLKLAIDTIRPVGVSQMGPPRPSIYDPPEFDEGIVLATSDIWALGVTITEAMTQYPPTWLHGRTDPPSFPTNLPSTFAETVKRCLGPDPDERPTVAQLQVQTKPGEPLTPPPPVQRSQQVQAQSRPKSPPSHQPQTIARPETLVPQTPAPLPLMPEPALRADIRPFSEHEEEPKRGVLVPTLIALLLVGGAVWAGTRLVRGSSGSNPTAAASEQTTAPDQSSSGGAPAATASDQSAAPGQSPVPGSSQFSAPKSADSATNTPPIRPDTPASNTMAPANKVPPAPIVTARAPTSPSATNPPSAPRQTLSVDENAADRASGVLHEEIPNVSVGSRNTIQGHVRVGIKVIVDSSGSVSNDILDNPSPSKYFNRMASEAARKWRFAAAADQSSREWLLRFEFGRDGTTVHAVGPRS